MINFLVSDTNKMSYLESQTEREHTHYNVVIIPKISEAKSRGDTGKCGLSRCYNFVRKAI